MPPPHTHLGTKTFPCLFDFSPVWFISGHHPGPLDAVISQQQARMTQISQ